MTAVTEHFRTGMARASLDLIEVKREIVALIEPTAWQRCATVNKAEQQSLRTILDEWRRA